MTQDNYPNLKAFIEAVLYGKPVGWSRKEAAREAERLIEILKATESK